MGLDWNDWAYGIIRSKLLLDHRYVVFPRKSQGRTVVKTAKDVFLPQTKIGRCMALLGVCTGYSEIFKVANPGQTRWGRVLQGRTVRAPSFPPCSATPKGRGPPLAIDAG